MKSYSVVEYKDNLYILWDCKNYEGLGSCCYERIYKLMPLDYISKNTDSLIDVNDIEANLIEVDITGKLKNPVKIVGDIKFNNYYKFKEPSL